MMEIDLTIGLYMRARFEWSLELLSAYYVQNPYVDKHIFFGRWTIQIAPNFFWLNPTRHSKFHKTSNTLRLLPNPVGLLVLPCTCQCRRSPPPLNPSPFFLSQTEEPAKAGICARDRRALRQLALNVHVKHSDLT